MRTSNPVFASEMYQEAPSWAGMLAGAAERPRTMTVQGTAWKTLYLLLITIAVAAASWGMYQNNPGLILPTMIGSLVGGFVSGIVMFRIPKFASFLVPIFAFAEGLFVAAISVAIVHYSPLASRVGGDAAAYALVGQAAGLSLAIAAGMLFGYATGVLRLSGLLAKAVVVMTIGVGLYYLGSFVVNLAFGSNVIPRIDYSASPIGIAFSVLVVVLASLMLLLDFQWIDDGAKRGLPKHYEWIGAFGILTSIVWLYIEVLKLLAKLRSE